MDNDYLTAILKTLHGGGPVCREAARFIAERGVRIGFAPQHTSARWTLDGRIELNPRPYGHTPPHDPRLLGAVVHEATHLAQGAALALTVAGEVGGWKAEFHARAELNAPILNTHWRTLAHTPESPTDRDLRQARATMLKMTGYRYLIWLLPLRPNPITRAIGRIQRLLW